MTLPEFLGLKGLARGIGRAVHHICDCLGNVFPDLKTIPPPDQLPDDVDPATEAAANIQKDEQAAAAKIRALRYLGGIGCGCYPGVEEAFLAAFDDCTEEVRFEAAKALRTAAGTPCKSCRATACCSELVMKRLDEVAYKTNEFGCPVEPSPRVRRMARLAMQSCGGVVMGFPPTIDPEFDVPDEGPRREPPPPPVPAPLAARETRVPQEDARETPQVSLATFAQAAAGSQNAVLARVNDEPIWQREVELLVQPRLAALLPELMTGSRDSLRRSLLRHELELAIERKLLSQEARRRMPAWEMAAVMTGAVQEAKDTAGGTLANELEAAIAEQALAKHWLEQRAQKTIDVPAADLLAVYQSHPDKHLIPAGIRWEKVTIPAQAVNSESEAHAAIDYLRRRTVGDTSVERPPPGASAATSSQAGWTSREQMASDALANALFRLPVGQVSPVIDDDAGWHIVRVLERRAARRMSFDEARESIRQTLVDERGGDLRKHYVDELRRRADVRYENPLGDEASPVENASLSARWETPAAERSSSLTGPLRRLPSCSDASAVPMLQ